MPKLFVASGIFHPEPGGPSTYLKAILPALQAKGWEPRVLTFGAAKAVGFPYSVRRIPRDIYPLRLARYGVAARRHLAWADLVFAQTIDLPLWGGRGGPRVIKIVGDQAWERCIRKGWIPSDMTADEFQRYEGDWRVRWQKRSRARQVAKMDAVIVPSQYLKRMVAAWGIAPAKIHVIYNGVSLPDLPQRDRAELRAELNWADQPTLVTVARLQPWKGIDHLINAIADMSEVRLIVVGDGPDRGRLAAMAQPLGKRVQFTGRVSPEEAHQLMFAADGLALYSGYEGLSHTILESMRLGTPVLASDIGGNAEVVRHGINGILAPHVDIDALRSAIRLLLQRRAELAANCRSSLARFDFARMTQETDLLLQSLLR